MRSALAAFVLVPSLAFANCTDDAMLVFDASSSMVSIKAAPERPARIVEARAALREALPEVAPLRRIGLMVYGPGETQSCGQVDLYFAPEHDAADRIISEIDAVEPDGSTALTRAVENAAHLLTQMGEPGTVVLVTDGEETCGGRTCEAARAIAATEPNVTVHVIGFRMRQTYLRRDYSEFSTLMGGEPVGAECLAAQTGGLFVTAFDTAELVDALRETLGCPLNS